MLPKKNRLGLRKEFAAVTRRGKRKQGSLFNLVYVFSSPQDPSQIAFVVAKKVDNRAVIRNRIRRLFSQAVYSLLPRIKPGARIIIFGKKEMIGKKSGEVGGEVERVFEGEGLLI